jgi:hypothetical protein
MTAQTPAPPTWRWRLIALGVASALAVLGTVWLAFRAPGHVPEWLRLGATSPLALKCLGVMVGGAAVLAVLLVVLVRARVRRSGGFHRNQGGSAAIEMALVFPLALMIFLVIIQAALLFNANMVVHYSAFAAARVATVIVPAEIDTEGTNLVWPPEIQPSTKLELIRRAAVLALLPVSASLTSGAGGSGGTAVEGETTAIFQQMDGQTQPWFRRIKPQYDYADANTQIELAKPGHWQDGNPDNDCPNHRSRRTTWSPEGGWAYEVYCPYYHSVPMIWDFWDWEDLHVRVTYQYLLEVPYASRFLGEEVHLPDRTGRQFATEIRVVVSLTNEGGTENVRPQG